MKDLETVLKAVADRNRLRILKLLECRNMCVCELAFVLNIKQPSVSRHLKKLKTAGLIEARQDGYWTEYMLSDSSSIYSEAVVNLMKQWLNDDATIQQDLDKAEMADRSKL